MSADNFRRASSGEIVTARIFIIGFGIFAFVWGLATLPEAWSAASLERIANHVVAGEPYKLKTLTEQESTLEQIEQSGYCLPTAVRSAALVRLRIFEMTSSGIDKENIDDRKEKIIKSIRNSLSCTPADALFWLALYSVENSKDERDANKFELLRLSYQLGPNEGWIGLKRNPIALANYEQLPPDLKRAAVTEFADLLNSGFVRELVAIFTGPGWPVRKAIVAGLHNVGERPRQAFADALYEQGFDVVIPGATQNQGVRRH